MFDAARRLEFACGLFACGFFACGFFASTASAQVGRDAQMSGYLLVPNDRVSESFDAGFSMYVAAWPLVEHYPGNRFQTGLFGTWMHPKYEEKPEERLYTDIEGGLGWWRDTRFATETPKFIMGGVALNFRAWANGPGAGKGRDWERPNGKYAVVQLSPWVLWPPDGLNLKQGTCGELFGYGYLPLPLTDAMETTGDEDVPTGNQCWTLFLNTATFKGPVTFFAPWFWTEATIERPDLEGMFLDVRPSQPNRALQMETQWVPASLASDGEGRRFARVADTLFPKNVDGGTVVVHRIMSYRRAALWDAVERWFDGGEVASGRIDSRERVIHRFPGHGGATWRIFHPSTPREERVPLDWASFATPTAFGDDTFGYRWDEDLVDEVEFAGHAFFRLPRFYRLDEVEGTSRWTPVAVDEVPRDSALREIGFDGPIERIQEPYVTPDGASTVWKDPGPVAGPFKAFSGDGSEVTYAWYRFVDQPALRHASLSDESREALQARVELLHRHWTREREYLEPPSRGELAEIDPALLLTPPEGLEVGYVPIVLRQGWR